MKVAMKKLLYVGDLAVVANGKQELHESLEECNGLFTRSAVHRPPEVRAGHRAGGEETDPGDSFVYLGGAVCGDGKTERRREVCRRAQARTNAWRADKY